MSIVEKKKLQINYRQKVPIAKVLVGQNLRKTVHYE
jgi:hypothetical protein